ncbi:hypothetical protein V496_09572 [Pseudogymnoascus sp. VKM F-4515 (FW-2607)]|nr:hypothetical protein V496_09572 [Pseudogymnoascus sp. VKM F-4515 (FW-2607)]
MPATPTSHLSSLLSLNRDADVLVLVIERITLRALVAVDVARVDGAEGYHPVPGHVLGFVGVCFDPSFPLLRYGPGLHGGVEDLGVCGAEGEGWAGEALELMLGVDGGEVVGFRTEDVAEVDGGVVVVDWDVAETYGLAGIGLAVVGGELFDNFES